MNRRTDKGYKLRVYLDAIKDVIATSDEEWLNKWIYGQGGPYISKADFIAYLEACVVVEAEQFLNRMAA